MLRQRLITAFLLIPPVVLGLVTMPTVVVAVAAGLVGVVAAWEWAALSGLEIVRDRVLYVLVTVVAMLLVYGWLTSSENSGVVLFAVALVWWCVAFIGVVAYQLYGKELTSSPTTRGIAGLLTMVPSWGAVVVLHGSRDGGPYLVLFLLALVWGADSAAYFFGRRFGKHRLADKVSPGKTWEGVAGSLGAISLVALVGTSILLPEHVVMAPFVALCLVTGMVSILGDLVESQFKRLAGVKDSGSLLPGHGGILDRIDSLTAAAPIFVLGAIALGIRL